MAMAMQVMTALGMGGRMWGQQDGMGGHQGGMGGNVGGWHVVPAGSQQGGTLIGGQGKQNYQPASTGAQQSLPGHGFFSSLC